jgi:3-hydroxyisobutyrate dehydrogenase-like beta-hydroxyacid dehydrogenase
MARRLAFIGLGVMGFPMAAHLQRAGHAVTVFNRSPDKAARWVEQCDGDAATTPRAAASDADCVLVCVGNDDDVRAVVYGQDGVLEGMAQGTYLVDHTTTSAHLAREMHVRAAVCGVGFVDAPVSGGQAGAEKGQLTVMCGGERDHFVAVEPIIAAYARACRLMGPAGAGQLTKMVNQICIAGLVQGLAEGLHFAERSGLDAKAVVDIICKGAAQSWQMDNRAATMIDGQFDFGFAVEWMRKDLRYALDEARDQQAHLPVTALVDQFYSEVQALGGNRWDTSSLIQRLRALAGERDEGTGS